MRRGRTKEKEIKERWEEYKQKGCAGLVGDMSSGKLFLKNIGGYQLQRGIIVSNSNLTSTYHMIKNFNVF